MNNKHIGNCFENQFAKIMSTYGCWVYNTINKAGGQPADIIAVRNGKAFLIDCKVCENDVFVLSRIEENQRNAMELFAYCNNGEGCYFALKFADESIYIVQAETLFKAADLGTKKFSKFEIIHYQNFSMRCDEWAKEFILCE